MATVGVKNSPEGTATHGSQWRIAEILMTDCDSESGSVSSTAQQALVIARVQ